MAWYHSATIAGLTLMLQHDIGKLTNTQGIKPDAKHISTTKIKRLYYRFILQGLQNLSDKKKSPTPWFKNTKLRRFMAYLVNRKPVDCPLWDL